MYIKVSKQRGKSEYWIEAYETGGTPIFHAIKSVYKNPLNGVYYFDHQSFETLDEAMKVAKAAVRSMAKGDDY